MCLSCVVVVFLAVLVLFIVCVWCGLGCYDNVVVVLCVVALLFNCYVCCVVMCCCLFCMVV